jgi:preprotein translocase subunit YajC
MLYALILLAQEEKTRETIPPSFLFIPLVLLALYFIIVILPGKRRQEKERQALLTNLEKGDEVLTIAGIYGTVVTVNPTKNEVTVKVDDGTRLRMTKESILRNMGAEERAKAAKEQKDKQPATEATK